MLSVIIGRRRQGKSTLALSLARAENRTTIIFDPNDQYGHITPIGDVETFMQNADERSIARIVPSDPISEWEQLAEALDGGGWRWGEYVLILDEASMLMQSSRLHPALERYARTSPKDVGLILTSHRTVDIHTLFRALATDWYLFHQHLDRDLETIADNFGVDVAEASSTLAEYHLIHYWLAKGGTPEWAIWSNPADWYIDIGRTT